MALSISILTAFGFMAIYWKIRSMTRLNTEGYPINIVVDGYKDQAARMDGANPIATRSFEASGAALAAIDADDELSAAYTWLKNNVPEFSGAVDAQP